MSKSPSPSEAKVGLDEFAALRGVPPYYHDLQGERREVPETTRARLLEALGETFDPNGTAGRAEDLVPPRLELDESTKCYLPSFIAKGRAWGISLQLYELRSERNWGIGDFADLEDMCGIAAEAGADFVGVNPMHALFLADPARCSPYSPSNRSFLNPIYIAVDRLPGFEAEEIDRQTARRLRSLDTIDYVEVSDLKLAALRKLRSRWLSGGVPDAESEHDAFGSFRKEGGKPLRGHALFETLSFHMVKLGHGSGWSSWPEEYRNAKSAAVRRFAEDNDDEVEFHIWLQWIAARQLAGAADHARRAGMRIGLYFDFAVGEAPDGSSTWSAPELILPGLRVGAPPDVFSTYGQDWGLVALSPKALQTQEMRPYADLLDASMRYAGALRVDHAMALWQLFLLPEGETPAVGGYLRYPFQDMVRALADVSHRRRTIVIGEDLGNVPEGFRDEMEKARILGYRVLYFEEAADGVFDPAGLSPLTLACFGTHDLPPLISWWKGDDIRLAQTLGLADAATTDQAMIERGDRRRAFIEAIRRTKPTDPPRSFDELGGNTDLSEEAVIALHRILARSPSRLVVVRLADLVGEDRATNVPGTSDAYPNWKLKLRIAARDVAGGRLFRKVTAAVSAERPRMEE